MKHRPPQFNAITILEEIKTDGHSPLKVIAENGEIYYVKNAKGRQPDYYILNEYICNFLLSFWDIPTPKIASIVIDKELLDFGNFSQHHKHFYYDIPAFGSKEIDQAVEMNQFFIINNKYDFNKFINPKDILKIGLFDIWVENTDRKPMNNNILVKSNGKAFEFIAIDHAFAFDSQSYENLNTHYIVNTVNENILYTDFAQEIYSIISKETIIIDQLKEYFYFYVQEIQKNFNDLGSYLPEYLGFNEDLKNELERFLFSEKRNKMVFDDFVSRL